jgi:molecular chaperone GrpE
MKAIAKSITKEILSSKILMKQNISASLVVKNFSSVYKLNHCNKFSFNKTVNKGIFSSDKNKEKKEEDATKTENKSDEEEKVTKKEKKQEESEEVQLLREKNKELKTLHNDQTHKMEVLKKKFEDLRSAYLANVEETEQIKLRNDRELANTKEYAISKFAKDLLDVHDNFTRAMDSISDKDFATLKEEEKNETFNNFLEGIQLTQCGLSHVLKRHMVYEYSPMGEKFDPHKHEAVFDYDDEEQTPGTVGQVLQSGFKIGERILRPAKVGVIKKKSS